MSISIADLQTSKPPQQRGLDTDMELYACGFNAWNQLVFDSCTAEEADSEPKDRNEFECVLTTEDDICSVRAGLSWTLVRTSSSVLAAGRLDASSDELKRRFEDDAGKTPNIAVAGNGKIAAVFDNKINEYSSWAAYPSTPSRSFDISPVSHLVAGACTFAALIASQPPEVVTWGDERYSACLGRDVDFSRASDPDFVPDLADLPTGNVTQISAVGGHIFAALTAGKDAYVWGVGEGLSGSPEPLDLGGEDVVDVAVGEGHMLALTADGRVWVWGKGANGQLGLGTKGRTEGWEVVQVSVPAGRKFVGVAVGERSSFLVAK